MTNNNLYKMHGKILNWSVVVIDEDAVVVQNLSIITKQLH